MGRRLRIGGRGAGREDERLEDRERLREGGRRQREEEEGKRRGKEKDTFTKGSIPWLSSFSYNLDSFYATLVY